MICTAPVICNNMLCANIYPKYAVQLAVYISLMQGEGHKWPAKIK